MSFTTLRHTLFTVHMWIGLIVGVLLAALGLSGSLIVYDQEIADLLSPPPHAVTAGTPLPLTMIADTARETAAEQGIDGGQMQILLPQKSRDAVVVRLGGISPMGNMAGMNREGRRHGECRRAAPKVAAAVASRCTSILSPAKCWARARPCCRRSSLSRISCTATS